jgi:hypothetical protein
MEVEDTVSIPWKEVESQPEELGEYFFEEFEDSFDTQRPTLKENKPYQSSFEFEDMISPYDGGERDVQQFSGATGTIEVETSRGSLLCGVSSRSHAIPTSILTWCRGHCWGAWKGHLWPIMENLRQFISSRL